MVSFYSRILAYDRHGGVGLVVYLGGYCLPQVPDLSIPVAKPPKS